MQKDDELTVDFSKVGDFFKRKKKVEPKTESPKAATPELLADKHATAPHEHKKDDEDISIDFKKVLGWFKTDEPKHPEHHAHPPASVEKEEDVSIDVKKIVGWFKGKEHAPAKDDDIGFDFSKITRWIKAHPIVVVLALLLIFQFVPARVVIGGKEVFLPWGGAWMRLQNEDLPPAQGWAQNHVYGLVKNQLASSVGQQYPNLPDDRKNNLIEEEWQKMYKQQGAQLEQQVQLVAQQIKSFFQYEANGRVYTYMPDIDTYQWLRYARNLVEKGHVGDEVRNGVEWDNHMRAPLGSEAVTEMHPHLIAWMYSFLKIFSSMPLMQAATYFPILIILLAMIPAFFIGRRFSGLPGGIVAATMIGIMPAIMARTTWGHVDTDGYNVFFPLLCTWLFIEALDAKGIKKIAAWTAGLGIAMGVYAWAWPSGWWYIFDFIIIAVGALIAYETYTNLRHPKTLIAQLKDRGLFLGTFVLVSGIFVTLFTTFENFTLAPLQPLRFTVIKQAAHSTLWPNVYTTVAELNPIDIRGALGSVGGNLFIGLAALGIVFLLFKRLDGEWKIDMRYGAYFAIWLLAAVYASTKGVRFTLLLAPVTAVCASIGIGKLYGIAANISVKDFRLHPRVVHVALVLIVAFLLSGQARAAYGTSLGDIPIVNDAWWNALTAIKSDSRQDAIINSWWDFGHHFKYIADRPVTFDGASQNTPMAHWIGHVLATSDEKEAMGILRMLDCGSNNAFEVLNKQFDPVKSVKILYKIFKLDRKAALAVLAKEGVNEQEQVLKNTHCDPPENYFIASDDMIGKSGVWSHFGFWNFERARLWTDLRNKNKDEAVQAMMNDWNYTEEQAEQQYFDVQAITNENDANAWISPWPGILGGAAQCSVAENVVVCGNGLMYNRTNGDTVLRVEQGIARPPLLVRMDDNGRLIETRFNDSNVGIAALLYPTGLDTYNSVLASPELITSIFVKLYFLEGHGLKYFKEFDRQQLITGGQIVTYKLDWTGNVSHTYTGLTAYKNLKLEAAKPKAKENDTVSVYYTGALLNGEVFDSSIRDGKSKNITAETSFEGQDLLAPLTFTIGAGQVIEGFDAAVRGMKVGEEQIVQIPPNAAYGLDPKKHKLGNQTLRFKIKLVSISEISHP